MATEAAPESPQVSSGGGPAKNQPNYLIHPVVFSPQNKSPINRPSYKTALKKYLVRDVDAKKGALELLDTLESTANAFYVALDTPNISSEDFDKVSNAYLGLLSCFIDNPSSRRPPSAATKAEISPTVDGPLDAAGDNKDDGLPDLQDTAAVAAPALPTGTAPPSGTVEELRYAMKFEWFDALGGGEKTDASLRDMAFEAASVEICAALWKMKAASELCKKDPETGTDSATTTQAYKLLREAAGAFQRASTGILPVLKAYTITSVDYRIETVQSLADCCLADAQAMTVLRAIKKGNQPTLIAGLARDTAELYAKASVSASCVAMLSEKYKNYLHYKGASMEAYAHIFNAINLWKSEKVGIGLRSAEEASKKAEEAKKLADKYDKAAPTSLYKYRREHDQELVKVIHDTLPRMEKEATTVYFQTKAKEVAPLPAGQRLVSPVETEAPKPTSANQEAVNKGASGFHDLPPPPLKRRGTGGGCCTGLFSCKRRGCLWWLCFGWLCIRGEVDEDGEKITKPEKKKTEEDKKQEDKKPEDAKKPEEANKNAVPLNMSLLNEYLSMVQITLAETKSMIFARSKTALEALPAPDAEIKGTALITGGNSGIGVETVRALTYAGMDVILCARNVAEGQAVADEIKQSGVKGNIAVQQLDLSDLSSIKQCAEDVLRTDVASKPLNLVILNAGVMACPLTRTKQGFEMQIGVNHIGHFYLTSLLLPKLKAQSEASRIVAVSSEGHRMGSINLEDLNYNERSYGRWGAYGQSKLANILFIKELAKQLAAEGKTNILAYSLHPGVIATRLSRHLGVGDWLLSTLGKPFLKSASQGAATTITAATDSDLQPNGAYLKECAVAQPSKAAEDMEVAGKLWVKTEELIKEALAK